MPTGLITSFTDPPFSKLKTILTCAPSIINGYTTYVSTFNMAFSQRMRNTDMDDLNY